MRNSKRENTQPQVLIFEGRLDDFINQLKEMYFKVGNISVSYKRDSQNAVNTAITAHIEEKAKEWICPRIPSYINSDILTGIGTVGMIIASVGFVFGFFSRIYLISIPIGLIINWFGDSFDGSIARYRKRTRPHYGYYIDKIVDAFVVLILALGIGLSGFVKIEWALIFACMYMILMLNVDLKVYVKNECKNSFGLVGPTEARILGILLTIYMYFAPIHYYTILNNVLTQYDLIIISVCLAMFCIAVVDIANTGLQLNKQDTKDW